MMAVTINGSAGVTTNSGAVYDSLQRGTAVTASGTSVNFTGIPSWAKRITIMFDAISTNGTSIVTVQLGDSGGIETTGYSGQGDSFTTSGSASNIFTSTAHTVGFNLSSTITVAAATSMRGIATLVNMIGNTWVFWSYNGQNSGSAGSGTGTKTLSDVLTQIRITTVNGTDTFDAGTINIIYE